MAVYRKALLEDEHTMVASVPPGSKNGYNERGSRLIRCRMRARFMLPDSLVVVFPHYIPIGVSTWCPLSHRRAADTTRTRRTYKLRGRCRAERVSLAKGRRMTWKSQRLAQGPHTAEHDENIRHSKRRETMEHESKRMLFSPLLVADHCLQAFVS